MKLSRPCRLVLTLLLLSGCGPAFNAASGEDKNRAGALAFALDVPGDDRVSASQGDNTDWKSFELLDDATVRVRIWWDEPEVEARTTLHDERAKRLAKVVHRSGARHDEITAIDLVAGLYFIKVEATDGASVYTLEVLTGESQDGHSTGNRPGF